MIINPRRACTVRVNVVVLSVCVCVCICNINIVRTYMYITSAHGHELSGRVCTQD